MSPSTTGRHRHHRRLRLTVAGLLLAGLAACGSDEAATRGNEVEGRAPTTDAPQGSPTTAGDTTTAPAETPTTEAAAPPGPLAEVAVTLTEVASADAPTKLVARPGRDLLYVAEQGGRVLTVDPGADAPSEVLDLGDQVTSGGEQGLLGLAFSPDGDTLYVHHSGPDGETRVASYAMDGDVADPDSRTDLLEVDQPFTNHNGGEILVDDAGLLWVGLGDGGSGGDPDDRAQDPDDLLGKILRIDPTEPADGRPYGIPDGNPYADGGGAPEIAITGLRNPWRFRLDPATGDLWVADVGQDDVEEIDRVPADAVLGTNLGWSHFEGTTTFDDSHEVVDGPALGPVFEMTHDDGWCSVSGGPVYRGTAIPDLAGAYLFGDYCKAGLNAIRLGDDGVVDESLVLDADAGPIVSIDVGRGRRAVRAGHRRHHLPGRPRRLRPAPGAVSPRRPAPSARASRRARAAPRCRPGCAPAGRRRG